MSVERGVTGRRLAGLAGIVLVVASLGLAMGQWYSTRGPLQALAFIEGNRSPGDSAAYASALYHAGHARRIQEGRWGVTGYATLGVAGALLGLALLGVSRRRRAEGDVS